MDLLAGSVRHAPMDDDDDIMINLLCIRIGMIMEDASVIALTMRALNFERIAPRSILFAIMTCRTQLRRRQHAS